MRLIFSKDRPAQLDLLLRSLERYAPADEATEVIWYGSTFSFRQGYANLFGASNDAVDMTTPGEFDQDLRDLLEQDDTVTFFCDDDVVYRPVPEDPREWLWRGDVLAFSWRLPAPWPQPYGAPSWAWNWTTMERHGRGYPGSIDGHTFRTADVLEMIGGEHISNPLILETVLALGCERLADRRPLMAAWPEQVLVGVPVNTVSDDMLRPNGQRFPQSPEELNRRFLAGERIDLDALDFAGVAGVLHEIEYAWHASGPEWDADG